LYPANITYALKKTWEVVRTFADSLSTTGLILGTVFLAFSLTPSLLPRTSVVQGLLTGFSFSAGYAIGTGLLYIWNYLELRAPGRKWSIVLRVTGGILSIGTAVIFFRQSDAWQDAARELLGAEPYGGFNAVGTGLLAFVVFLLVLLIFRLFRMIYRRIREKLRPYVPRRVSFAISLVLVITLFVMIANGILFRLILLSADITYNRVDALLEPEYEAPSDPLLTGSSASFLKWEDAGLLGRRFLANIPTDDDLSDFFGEPVKRPIRVYAGMRVHDDPVIRARLALQELIRVGAFNRSLLIIITPTGRGWVDPASIVPLEYLHRGDVASVAMQYSYLPSPLSLFFEPDYGLEATTALFREVYRYWAALPQNNRPKLYLSGLSLGAMYSDLSFDFFDIINNPFHGALWSGPPYRTRTWMNVMAQRNQDSPYWKPKFRDGTVVRFSNQDGGLETMEGKPNWGAFRIGFLQYGSDPVTFFSPRIAVREPEWMSGERAFDINPEFRWYPIVTMLQIAADMITGTAPKGFGHEYSALHYLDAWYHLTEPSGWDSDSLKKLRGKMIELDE